MSATPPPSLTAAPTPAPQRGDRTTFANRVDAFVTWLISATTQFGALAANVYANAVDAFNSATAAALSATTAQAAADSAALVAGATQWVTGTTYAKGVCVWSPINLATYRRKLAGAGTTDPSGDATNWAAISYITQFMKVSDQKATGTNGGASLSADITQTRVLNTVDANTIPGASLASNTITLPAGTYKYRARAPAREVNAHKLFLYNSSDGVYVGVGASMNSGNAANIPTSDASVSGQFTLGASKNLTLRHYTALALSYGLGSACGISGQVEMYAEVEFTKVA